MGASVFLFDLCICIQKEEERSSEKEDTKESLTCKDLSNTQRTSLPCQELSKISLQHKTCNGCVP